MEAFTTIVETDNTHNTCTPKVKKTFTNDLRMNNVVLNAPPPPEYTFRGRNQQQGIRAVVDAAMGYTPATIDVKLGVPNVSENPKAVGEQSLDARNNV
jgi:hypothetical protein